MLLATKTLNGLACERATGRKHGRLTLSDLALPRDGELRLAAVNVRAQIIFRLLAGVTVYSLRNDGVWERVIDVLVRPRAAPM